AVDDEEAMPRGERPLLAPVLLAGSQAPVHEDGGVALAPNRDVQAPGARHPTDPNAGSAAASSIVGVSKALKRANLESPRGSGSRLSRDGRLDANRAACAGRAHAAPRRRTASLRLRRGDAAAASPLVGRPARLGGDLR